MKSVEERIAAEVEGGMSEVVVAKFGPATVVEAIERVGDRRGARVEENKNRDHALLRERRVVPQPGDRSHPHRWGRGQPDRPSRADR